MTNISKAIITNLNESTREKLREEQANKRKKLRENDGSKLAKFIDDSVKTLQTSDITNCKYDLDDNLAVFVGWSDGYDAEDTDNIKSEKNPTYAINVGIKVRNDADFADFDSLNFIIDNETGDVWDSTTTLEPNYDSSETAKWLMKEYVKMKKALDSGKYIVESCSTNSKEELNETGEWDDSDEEMAQMKEDLSAQAKELADKIHGNVQSVNGFDKYQGPYAIISTPKHGDIELWFDQDDYADYMFSFIAKIAHEGWIRGGIDQLAEILNKDDVANDIIQEEDQINIHANAKDRDYVITDVTVLEPVGDGDIQSPNIQALLLDLEEALSNKYGDDWGTINIQTTKKNKESSFALIETELAKDTFLMNFIVNHKNKLKEFVVTNTNGTTIYKKKTTNPVKAMVEWVDTELLIGENTPLKKLQEADNIVQENGIDIENIEEFINSKMNPEIFEAKAAIDCLIKGLKDVPNENKEYVKNFIKDKINSLIVELPRKMKKGKDEKNQKLMFPTSEEIITKVFGKEWIKQDKLTEGTKNKDLNKIADKLVKLCWDGTYHDAHTEIVGVLDNIKYYDGEFPEFRVYKNYNLTNKEFDKLYKLMYDKVTKLLKEGVNKNNNINNYIYSNAESEDKSDAESMIYSTYKPEAPKLNFQIHKEGPMYFVDFIGSKEDIIEYLVKLGWYTEEEANDLVKPYNKVNNKVLESKECITEAEVLQVNTYNDPHGTCDGKLNDGTYFIVGNGEGAILDCEGSKVYELSDEEAENFYKKHVIKDLSDKEVEDLLNKIKNFKSLNKINEAYDNITIGDISLVYNPQTYEALYSIDSADVHDKRINLSKVPTVQTPYDTETIIKDFVEKKYGPIPQEESKESVSQEDSKEQASQEEPKAIEEPVDTETIDVQMQDDTVTEADEELDNNDTDALANIDIDNTEETNTDDETPEDIENIEDEPVEEKETGSANFFRMPKSVEDMRIALQDGVSQGKSTYLVVQEKELNADEFNEFADNLKSPQSWLGEVRPEDLKNYAFNVVKVTCPGENYSILVDPSATNFAKFAAILDENI